MKRGWRRKILIGLGVVVVLLAGLVAFAPQILSSGFVREMLAEVLTEELGARVTIEGFELSWSGPLALRGIAIHVPDGEFAGDEILRLDDVRLESGVWRLWQGVDVIALHLEGLRITVDERGGGRTSLDSFFGRFLPALRPAPRPARKPVPKPERPPRFDVTLSNCSVRVRRLPYSPPEHRINPFREDVPIRAAGEGFDTYELSAATLQLLIDGDEIDAKTEGSFAHGVDTTVFRADVHVRHGVPRGNVEIDEFDLRLMDPFVAGRLSGRVSAKAQGSLEDGRLNATLTLEIKDLVTDRLREDWIRATLHVGEKESLYAVGPLDVASASGRFALAGSLDIPKNVPFRPSGELTGTFPLDVAYRAFADRPPPAEAQIRFSLESHLQHEGGHAAGTIFLDHFTVQHNLGEVDLSFDIVGDRAAGNLRIDKLDLRCAYAHASVRGIIHHGPDWSLDLAGEADGDLDQLSHAAAHFLPKLAEIEVAGICRIDVDTLRMASDGSIVLRAGASASNLKARGIAPGLMEYPALAMHVDASLLDGGDRLVVRSASFQDVRISGSASGLLDPGAWPDAEATANGTVPLTPRLARFLGVNEFRHPEGVATVDIKLAAAGGDARLEGAIGVHGLDFQIGDYDHEDPDLDWRGKLEWRDRHLTGNFTLKARRLQATVRALAFDTDTRSIHARAELIVPDASALSELLPNPRWRWSGRHEADVDVTVSPETLRIEAVVRSPDLRLQLDGYGLAGDRTEMRARIARENGAWLFRDAEVRVPARQLVVASKELRLRDGEISGPVSASGDFEKLHALVEPLRTLGIRGDFRIATELRAGESIEASLDFDSTAFAIGDESVGTVALRIPRTRVGREFVIPEFSLRIGDDLTATGALTVADELKLHVEARGKDLGWVTHLVDGVDGSGAFSISTDLRAPRLLGDGEYAATGTAHADRLTTGDDVMLESIAIEAKEFSFRAADGHLHDVRIDAEVSAARAQRHEVSARNVTFHNMSSGTIRADASGPGLRVHVVSTAGWIRIDDRQLDGLTLDGWGTLKSLDLEDARAIHFDGKLRFDRIPAAVLDWTRGTADFSFHSHVLDVKKLVATVQEGRMTGSAHFDFRGAHVPWNVKLLTVDARIDKGFSDPLSYIIPVLRVGGDKNSEVSGFASWDVNLRGIDFGFDDLEKHLVGSGYLRLRDTRVRGSLLLPLLSLRVGRLLLNKPFVIPDSTAHWSVKNGLVTTQPLKISAEPFGIRMGGTVTLRGHLDYIFHPGILLVPINVKGKWDNIKVVPTARELLPKWPFK